MPDIAALVNQYWNSQPHPMNPKLTVGDYSVAIRLATHAKFGGHATPEEAGAFWDDFNSMNNHLTSQGKQPITPHEMTHLIDQMAPVSFAYHGRPPSIREIAQHRDSAPDQVRKYYHALPDPLYPHVPAGDMAAKLTVGDMYANMHLGRKANKVEGAHFYHGNMGPEQVNSFYQSLKQQRDEMSSQKTPQEDQSAGQDRGR